MAKKPSPEPDDKEQSRRFVETAHQVAADESGAAFDRAFKKIVPIKRAPPKRKKSRQDQG